MTDDPSFGFRVGSLEMQEALTNVATLIGRKWHLVIIDQLLTDGPMGFSELLKRIGNISSKVLSESLTDLEENGFISREVISDRPFRVQYAVTERGRRLRPIVEAARTDLFSGMVAHSDGGDDVPVPAADETPTANDDESKRPGDRFGWSLR
jgi:DNA-binding HxlR family transcriptional regulator